MTRKFALICLLLLAPLAAWADAPWPSKPIKVIVQFGAGTSTDLIARLVGQKLSEAVGQPVVIENRPGGNGITGTAQALTAPADGHTLVMAVSSVFGIHPSLYSKLPFDVLRDFAPITNLALVEQTLVVPAAGTQTLQAIVESARAAPGKVAYASLGSGSTSHLTMEMFATAAGVRLNHIPFKSSGEASTQLIGGTVPMMFDSMPAVMEQVRAGRLKAVAIASAKRSPFLPDVPTLSESGYQGIVGLGWIGMAAPAATPAPVLDRLNREIVAIVRSPEMRERLDRMAYVPVGDSREEFGRFMRAEIARWSKTVRDSGAKAD